MLLLEILVMILIATVIKYRESKTKVIIGNLFLGMSV